MSVLKTIPDALQRMQELLRAGQTMRANQLLEQVLALDPSHTEAARWRDHMDTLLPLERFNQLLDGLLRTTARANQSNSKLLYQDILTDPKYADPRRLERHGAKFYSQNDEDGIIEEIFRRIGTTNRTFLEFGVDNGLENNTLLLTYKGWQGVWMDGSARNIAFIEETFKPLLTQNRLRAFQQWITPDTIDDLILSFGLPVDLDLLSIDIDSYDYHVFEQITVIRPRVVIIEYNAKLPPPIRAVMAYDPSYRASAMTDYFGCSLESLTQLAERKGYHLVGCNITGINAFFVRADLCRDLFYTPATAEQLYQPPRYELYYTAAFHVGHPVSYGEWVAP
jgi:hypothetical protein